MTDRAIDDQVSLLMQGTEYGDDELKRSMAAEIRQRLKETQAEGRPLRVYCGFDPRTADLHIGHTVPIRKLRQFQELGHEVYFVIGRFTALIGDPSHEDKVRAPITMEEATLNAESYAEQAFRILDPAATKVVYNDEWLAPLTFRDVIELAQNFTVQQFLSRDSFRERWEQGDPIYTHEFLYAVMQAYDAYHLRTDVQVGGSDQLFNIITAARKLMESMGAKPNIGIIMGILPGTDGVVKMSKSLGNHIPLLATPEDMYGKVMSIPDDAMSSYFRLVTRWNPQEIEALEAGLVAGELHPRDVKMELAREIVGAYQGDAKAEEAEQAFRRVFQQQKLPRDVDDFQLREGMSLVEVIVEAGLAPSNSQARRLIKQQAVRLEDQVLKEPNALPELEAPAVLRVGKRRFVRLLPP